MFKGFLRNIRYGRFVYYKHKIPQSYHRVGKPFDLFTKFKMITRASSYMMDLVKDSLIIVEILISQNGFASLMAQETPYIKGVRLLF